MRFRIALIAFLLIIVSVIVTLNFYFQKNYQSEMASQINKQQLTIAKTLSVSIENNIEHLIDEIVSLANLLATRGLEGKGLDKFVRHAFEELNEEVKVDILVLARGKRIVFSSIPNYVFNDEDADICRTCSSARKGEHVIIPSLTNPKLIKAMTPIVDETGNIGAVMILINIDGLNEKYLGPVKTGAKGNAWIMDNSGTLLYHPTMPEMVGRSIKEHSSECFECHKSFNAEEEILDSTEIGFRSYVAPYGEDKLIAFSRIRSIGWIVCLSIPYSEVTGSIKNSMRMHSMLILAIMFSTVFGAFFIIVINRARAKAEAKADYVDKVREYADELETVVNERTGELRSEKEKLDVLISSISAGIGIFSINHDLVWGNHVLMGWLGDKANDFTLADFNKLDADEGAGKAVVKDSSVQEVVQLDLPGKKGYFQASFSPYHMPDGTFRILMLLQDITDLKMAEVQMIQSDKLAALSRLSAGVSHEIGNPLTSISSYVQILKDMERDEFSTNALSTIYKHIGRIESILRKMSSFSRGRDEELSTHHVADLVESTVELVKYDKRAKSMSINMDVPRDLPPVNVNGDQLVQVIMNMVLNAADSMPGGGDLDISARVSGHWLDMAFRDNGSGISEENIKKIFEPFFTTKATGTGLGLPVCHSIVRLFGGEILVQSEPGKGTTFTVRLPLE